MAKVFDHGNGVTCWLIDGDYVVYAGEKLVRTCPSIGMAREVAAGL